VNGSVPWRPLGIALAWSLVSTLVVGGFLLLLLDNIWWGAAVAVAALFGGGFYVGDSTGESEPMYGSMLTGAYFGAVVAVIFAGTALEVISDPFPGLDRGDSTFFFVAPLLLLAAGVAGTIAGGEVARHDRTEGRDTE
jgi:hypothetical protein